MRWQKVPGIAKWAGYEGGQHVATIHEKDGETLLWVDAGNGFQRVHIQGYQPTKIRTWKLAAIGALAELREVTP